MAEFPFSADLGAGSGAEAVQSRRPLAFVALAAVLVLAVAAYFLLLKGHGAAPSAASSPISRVHIVKGKVVHHAAAKTTRIPKAADVNLGRDPFKALYLAPAPVTAPVVAPASTNTTPQQPTVIVFPASGNTQTVTPSWVRLTSQQGSTSATFVIGYSNHSTTTVTVSGKPGTIFAGDFAMVSLNQGVAALKFGDGQPFDVPLGQTVGV